MSRGGPRPWLRAPILGAVVAFAAVVPGSGGTLLWEAPFPPGGSPYALVVSPDGARLYVTGCKATICANKYMTVAHDAATGAVLWSRDYDGLDGDPDTAYDIGIAPDGSVVYVTGESDNGVFATLAYDAVTGIQIWEQRYKAAGPPCCLSLSPDGSRLYVSGTGSRQFVNHYATVAYDAATGAQLWEALYGEGYGNAPHAMDVAPDGSRVFVTGESLGPSLSYDYATVAYEASTGDQVWVARYDNPAKPTDYAYALAVDPASNAVYVSGSLDFYDNSDVGTIAYDAATGQELWVAIYDGPVGGYDVGRDARVSPDGSALYVAAISDQLTSRDYAVVAYRTSDGGQLWVGTYDGPTNEDDYVCCMDLSPDGTAVAVTGYSLLLGNLQFATVSFDTTGGGIRWAARNKGGRRGYNLAADVAFSPDGSGLYVTGTTLSQSGNYDFLTLAYQS